MPGTTAKKRESTVKRKTRETEISVKLNLNGSGKAKIETEHAFFSHMLDSLTRHSMLDLTLKATGDKDVDAHHTVEDVGIVIGEALDKALADKKGISRFGSATVPMDDALASAAIDLSGRPFLVYKVEIPQKRQWEFDVNLAEEFFRSLCTAGKFNLHLKLDYGKDYHHCMEAVFKAFAVALRQAVAIDPRVKGVPSTKGTL